GPAALWRPLPVLGGLKILPRGPGEPMALVNGARGGAAFAVVGALGATALLERSTAVLALSAEAFAMPLEHYDPDLKDLWGDPFEGRALGDLGRWLAGAKRPEPRAHQAPVSWRIAPRVLGVAQRAAAVALEVAGSALVSRSDNPAFIQDPGDPSRDRCLATGGYHNGQAARVLDGLNAAYADVCVLAAKQTTKLLDGRLSQLPPLLVSPAAPVVGTEFCAWMPTDFAERARWAATPALLSLGCDDPQGGQSDVASPVFIAYERHGVAVESLAAALAVLAWVSSQALWLAERPVAPPLAPLLAEVRALAPPLTPANAGHLGAGLAALARYLQDGE
ncbi:MAG: aromatic amino acid lyase, partial [Candidatus Competibacterales bacterium]